ncbi:F5/8 type C domain-containing protein [Spirosomataceae bacterium TFI 002]|nr:F5/8 type C domain-containing protein [Spirosomataceae bacterium TFI 002]
MKKLLLLSSLILLCAYSNTNAQCVGTAGQIKWSYWGDFGFTPDSLELSALENFPSRPDGSRKIGYTSTPENYADYMASFMRGFIKVPTTATYRFNVTGDDRVQFYLSNGQNINNLNLMARVPSYTGKYEHTDTTIQTSNFVTLTAGQYYYFELFHFEGTGGDRADLFWQKNTDPPTQWTVIDFNYLSEYACEQSCPERGTACDDGNPLTQNDQEDGFCNCVGKVPTTNNCIGERGKAEAYYFDNIPGSYVENDLLNAPKFPLLPDRKEVLKGAYGPLERSYSNINEYGSLVQGYLTVPVTGTYEFNLTGDDQTILYISSDESVANKQVHQAAALWGVNYTEHNRFSFQTIGPLTLEKGKYYYYEIRHKESGWRDHFNLHWKTPFHEKRGWKRIPSFYLYDYSCELSCIAQNTPCDDGNAFTNNDKYNGNCECVGTPCSGPDCDDSSARYSFLDECAPTNSVNTLEEFSWESCSAGAANPNPARGGLTKWVKYDFGKRYKFDGSRIWNYNVTGETDKGFKTVVVDYSQDGTTWTQLGGNYTWPIASGSSDYGGFNGPNFNQKLARYVLVSAVANWGDPSCAGFSKLTLDGTLCDPKDTPCDDKDPLTTYDKFDDNCNCRGVDINCGSDTLQLDQITLASGAYKAKMRLRTESLVPASNNISFSAGNSIVMLPGFKSENTAVFSAKIEDCIQAAFVANEKSNEIQDLGKKSLIDEETVNEKVKKVIFRVNEPSQVKLTLLNGKGETLVTILDHYFQNLGTQIKYIPTQRLADGTYTIELQIGNDTVKENFVVGDDGKK